MGGGGGEGGVFWFPQGCVVGLPPPPPSELSFVLQPEYRSKCNNLSRQVRNKSPQVIQFS
jgi:hypothetical protein